MWWPAGLRQVSCRGLPAWGCNRRCSSQGGSDWPSAASCCCYCCCDGGRASLVSACSGSLLCTRVPLCRAVHADITQAIKPGKFESIRPFALLQGSNGRAVTRNVTSQLQVWADSGMDAHIDAERLKVLLGALPPLAFCSVLPGQAKTSSFCVHSWTMRLVL